MPIKAILWDFGDTLADERWMLAPLAGVPSWPDAYRQFGHSALAERWNAGEISLDDVAAAFAAQLGVPAGRIRAHMESCSRDIAFFPHVAELVVRCPLPQAIVTVNPDIFSRIVVPTYRLAERFDPIVTSWQTGALDKAVLCDRAIEQLSAPCERAESLLIDNREDSVARWREEGGAAYLFRNERDLCERFDALVNA